MQFSLLSVYEYFYKEKFICKILLLNKLSENTNYPREYVTSKSFNKSVRRKNKFAKQNKNRNLV